LTREYQAAVTWTKVASLAHGLLLAGFGGEVLLAAQEVRVVSLECSLLELEACERLLLVAQPGERAGELGEAGEEHQGDQREEERTTEAQGPPAGGVAVGGIAHRYFPQK
jgi:hypothetical protein